MARDDPYNPLARENLGRSVENALLARPPVSLAALEQFVGAGVYALYYAGAFELYSPISDPECHVPIYVGKADVPGSRKGLLSTGYNGTALFNRLADHTQSIAQASNLDVEDLYCRHLIVDDIWIPLGESLMIRKFRPVWNVVVDGFGLHDPGGRRYGGLRSEWDELHPGRPWWDKMQPRPDPAAIGEKITRHFRENPPPPVVEVPI